MNNWKIPEKLEKYIINRDKKCVYCKNSFIIKDKKRSMTWEHVINDASIITKDNIVLCCRSCNSSKGSKKLADWLNSDYCKNKNINYTSVDLVIKKHLK